MVTDICTHNHKYIAMCTGWEAIAITMITTPSLTMFLATRTKNDPLGEQLALSLDIWPVPTKDNVIGFSCVQTMVVSTLIVSTYNCV